MPPPNPSSQPTRLNNGVTAVPGSAWPSSADARSRRRSITQSSRYRRWSPHARPQGWASVSC